MGTALEEQPEVRDKESTKEELMDVVEAADIISKSNLTNTQKIGVIKLVTEQKEAYSGPIPHPDHLEKYEKILSGSADRIIGMAENQSTHRQKLENKVVDAEIKYKNKGQIFGFIIALICIIGGILMIFFGKNIQGFATLLGTVVVLLGTFMYGNKNNNQNKD